MKRTAVAARALAALASIVCLAPSPVTANPATYVATPAITEGEREIELVTGAQRLRDGSSATGTALIFGYGIRSWWAAEVGVLWHRDPGDRFGYDAWEIENRFALTEPGQYPVDLGLLIEIEKPADRSEGYELRYGPLLQSQWGALQANLNLLFERHLRAADPPVTEFGYQWQLRWRANPLLDWGAQGFGATGPWRHWNAASEQSHQLGPALFGRVRAAPGAALKYDAAFLFGTGGTAPRRALRARIEYEFL